MVWVFGAPTQTCTIFFGIVQFKHPHPSYPRTPLLAYGIQRYGCLGRHPRTSRHSSIFPRPCTPGVAPPDVCCRRWKIGSNHGTNELTSPGNVQSTPQWGIHRPTQDSLFHFSPIPHPNGHLKHSNTLLSPSTPQARRMWLAGNCGLDPPH